MKTAWNTFIGGLMAVLVCLDTARAADLIILVPYTSTGTEIQQDERWMTVANQYQVYKEDLGLDTRVYTLDDINSAYATDGVDEPERIKRLIYNQAKNDGLQYVMLVGDTGIFPIRYQYFGYSSAGLTHWHKTDTRPWYQVDSYGFFPCDAYYANLWDDDDPAKAFDNWDADGDGFYGEKYYDNFRGIDGNTIHQDVAVGRIPCKNPDEFYNYMLKVMAYESHAWGMSPNALFIGGGFSTSQETKLNIGGFMDSLYEIAYLLGEHGAQWDFTNFSGHTTTDVDAHDTIIDHVNSEYPQFINYAGHGAPSSLWEPGFYRSDVSALTNFWQPSIVMAPGSCSTAKYALSDSDVAPRVAPVTLAGDNDSMAEAFLTDYTDGGVIFIGSIVSNQPPGLYFDERLFRAVEGGASTVGDCFRQAIDDYIAQYSLDTASCSTWETVSDWPDSAGGKWYWFYPARFQGVYKVQIFGDPSIRINGVERDYEQPVSTIIYNGWVNRQHLIDHNRDTYYLDAEIIAHDPYGIPIDSADTRYNYRIDGDLSQWRTGATFRVPVYLTASLEGNEDYAILYYSTNEIGHSESVKHAPIYFDFTRPVSDITSAWGDPDPVVVEGVLAFDGNSMRIEATDEGAGVARIDYRFGSGSSYRSASGASVEVDFPCFYMTDFDFSFRAVDGAGNAEEWNTETIRVPSCANYLDVLERFRDMLDAEAGRHMFDFPPSALDGSIHLGFDPDGDPTKVMFEMSGPFNGDYQGHDWISIGEALYNVKTDLWEDSWDTGTLGIENGFYWVRAMPEYPLEGIRPKANEKETAPHLIWVNNMANDNPEISVLSLSSEIDEARPGDSITLTAVFHLNGMGEANNVTLRLLPDEDLYQDLKEEDVVRKLANLKMDQHVDFEVTLKDDNLPTLDHLSFKVAMTADGIPLLTSSYLTMPLYKRPVHVSGTVRDTKGNPVMATLELANKVETRIDSTRDDGSYLFMDVASGVYDLTLTGLPRGYRPVTPKDGTLRIRSNGDHIEQQFIVAGIDRQAPGFTYVSSFNEVAETGTIRGMACDRNYGTGVDRIDVAVKDEIAQRYLDEYGDWQDDETTLPVSAIEECPTSYPVFDPAVIPDHGNLPMDTRCVTFSLDLPAGAALDQGRKTVSLLAQDGAGNEATHRMISIIRADFIANTTSGEAPLTVDFSSRATGAVDYLVWEFGDKSEVAEGGTVSHTFTGPGIYDIRLMAAGPDSNDEEIKTAYITVTDKSGSTGDDDDDGGGGGGCFIFSSSGK